MTPKEKAINLIEQFRNVEWIEENKKTIKFNWIQFQEAKQCALIVVDEVINNWKDEATIQFPYGKVINYWNVVKEEIEKL
jgi:hypothetical protein